MKRFLTLFLLSLTLSLQAQLPDGSIAPDWTMTDVDGNEWNLYQILAEGKTVIVEFTATWSEESWEYHESGALSEFYAQYGPDGSDEAMVFFMESDEDTNADDLNGTGGNTAGNWFTNTPYPIIDDAGFIAEIYDVEGVPANLIICPNRLLENVGLASTFSLSQLSQSCLVPGGQNNAGIYLYVGFEGDFCEERTFAPSVIWQNIGSENITSATFELYRNGALEETIDWSGDLEPYAIDPQAFAAVTVNENTTIDMVISSVNGVDDEDDSNNTWQIEATEAPSTDQNFLILDVTTDEYPLETYWEIVDENGVVFYQGGNSGIFNGTVSSDAYTEQSETYSHEVPLPSDGCFEFIVYDEFGDGICCAYGLGNYRLRDENFNILFQGGLFEAEDRRPFSLSGATTIDNDASISDYIGPQGDVCGTQAFSPVVTLRNQGASDLTMVELGISIGPDIIQIYPHTTQLATCETEVVQMDEITVDSTAELVISVLSVNGGQDIIPAGNTIEANITRRVTTTPPLTLDITTDEWGYEIYWEMRTLTGKVLASGGNEIVGPNGGGLRVAAADDPGAYPPFGTITEQFSLSPGFDDCYELLIVDDWGDGLGGNGIIQLVTEAGDILVNSTFPEGTEERYLIDAQLAPSNIQSRAGINDLKIYPNPVGDDLQASFSILENMELNVGIYDLLGQEIMTLPFVNYAAGENILEIKMGQLAAGVYFLKMRGENGEISKRIIKH